MSDAYISYNHLLQDAHVYRMNSTGGIKAEGMEKKTGSGDSIHSAAETVNHLQSPSSKATFFVQPSQTGARSESDQDMTDDDEEYESDESGGSSEFDEDACCFSDQDLSTEIPLTDEEIQGLIDQLLEVESKAAEAQELLEEESLNALKDEVKVELAETLSGLEMDEAVKEEMSTYVDQWKEALDVLEDKSALLQERLDDAGIDLPDLFRWIEKQAPEGCTTEAWKKRTHWVGLHASEAAADAVSKANVNLESVRPVKRHHGKFMEEGASGFLGRKFSHMSSQMSGMATQPGEGWESMDALFGNEANSGALTGFGTEAWASVYLAATPQQAALLGLPGAEQVEEIVDMDKCQKDPFIAEALASEKETGLTEEQKKNLMKVGEEEDIRKDKLMQRLVFRQKRAARRTTIPCLSLVTPEWKGTILPAIECAEAAGSEQKLGNSNDGICHLQEDVYRKRKDLQDGSDERQPISSNAGSGKSDNFNLGIPQASSKRLRTGEFSEVDLPNVPKFIINIDSDEDQEAHMVKQPEVYADQHLCRGPTKPCLNNKGEGDAGALNKEAEASNALQIGEKVQWNEKENRKDFMCTSCRKELHADEVYKHPRFDVVMCKPCKDFYQSAPFSKDTNGAEEECSWCGNGGDVVMCDFCDKVFCQSCIRSTFGEKELKTILSETEWACFCCNPEPLKPLTECFRRARELCSKQHTEDAFSSDDEPSEIRNRKEKRRKRLRRIIEDDELEESTKLKLVLEKERKERLDRLRESAYDSTNATTSSYMPDSPLPQKCAINVARDIDEEEIHIPLGISKFLKPHQIEGVRFMWENCIESLKKVKLGDQGNGCILAHSMGLGKTLQVIAFLYTVLKTKQLGFRTALIVTPVNVLLNWPDEFEKWSPSEMKQIPVYILDEFNRNRRGDVLVRWQKTGGVMMIGYTAFRILSSGKHVKDASAREKICKALQDPGPDILVCDEAHMIKNKKADITQALKQVKTQRRIALTGSPLQNNLMEYYCMVDFVREGFLGRPQDFKNRFQNPIENGQHADSTEYDVRCMKERTHVLHKQLVGFVQRKGANIVEKELPPKFIYVISVRLSPLQRALYNRFIQRFWLSNEQGPSVARSRKSLFSTYHSLAKLWNHPDLLLVTKEERETPSEDSMDDFICADDEGMSSDDTGYDPRKEDKRNGQRNLRSNELDSLNESDSLEWCNDLTNDKQHGVLDYSGKFVLLLDILSMSSARGEKALVFSQSIPTLNLIEFFLERLPRPGGKSGCWRRDKEWYRLDGQTKAKDRQRLVKRFNDSSNSKVQCVLISTRAGSLGINLQAANRVVILDGSWNPTHDIQALFRSWRFGQKKPVFVYRLLASDTAEEKIYKRQVVKEGLAARVLDEQQVGRHSKMEELKVLFKLDDDFIDPLQTSSMELKPQLDESITSQMENHFTNPCIGSDVSDHDAPEDEIMTSLLIEHRPKWIVRIHQHETLLADREDEKLTLEEQALAWEKFRRIMENSNVDWVQVNSESVECATSEVQNSWVISNQAAQLAMCSLKIHVELLTSRNIKANEHVKCENCLQNIGWEHITKGRPRGIH